MEDSNTLRLSKKNIFGNCKLITNIFRCFLDVFQDDLILYRVIKTHAVNCQETLCQLHSLIIKFIR